MKKSAIILGISVLVFSVFTTSVRAAKVTIASILEHTNDTTYSQNTYGVGMSVAADATYEKDLFLAGLSDTVFTGTTKEDVIIIGGNVLLAGTVEEDVRALGGIVRVSGKVAGDVVMLGGSLVIEEEAEISGDIVMVGGTIEIHAPVKSKINIISGSTTFTSQVQSRDVIITTYRLRLDESADVTGAITYFSPRQVSIDENASVTGTVSYNRIDPLKDDGLIDQAVVSFLNFWVVLRFVTTLLLAFLLVFIFKVFTQRTVDVAQSFMGKSFLVGLLSLVGIPALFILLLLSLILFPVAMLLLLATIFFWILAGAIAGVIVGTLVKKYFTIIRTETSSEEEEKALHETTYDISFNSAVIGVVLLTLVEFVPFIGDVVRLVFVIIAFGALWLTFYKYVRWGSLFTSFVKRRK